MSSNSAASTFSKDDSLTEFTILKLSHCQAPAVLFWSSPSTTKDEKQHDSFFSLSAEDGTACIHFYDRFNMSITSTYGVVKSKFKVRIFFQLHRCAECTTARNFTRSEAHLIKWRGSGCVLQDATSQTSRLNAGHSFWIQFLALSATLGQPHCSVEGSPYSHHSHFSFLPENNNSR